MTDKVCRWGILSAAHIAKKNWLAIKNSGNSVVAAVASRSKEKAQKFIDECNDRHIVRSRRLPWEATKNC